jgi:hypothetical protein
MGLLGTFGRDNLISGDKRVVTTPVLITAGISLLRGTVLGRVKVSVPTSATVTGTGDGTCTAVSGGANTVKGNYVAKCVRVVTHGGEFMITGPKGYVGGVLITAGAGGTGVFTSDQINLTITDGATDFIVGDSFTIAVTDGVPASGSLTGTGNGTLTEVEGRRDLKVGSYLFTCTSAVTHGGIFKVTDPDGNVIQTGITIPAGAGNSIAFANDQIAGKLTDGSTDFIVGDYFTVTTTIGPRQCVACGKALTNGASAPYAVLLEDVDATSAAKPGAAALEGQFNQRSLIFASGTDIEDMRDAMRDVGLIAEQSVAA